MTKKLIVMLLVVVMLLAMTSAVFAHPLPPRSPGVANPAAAGGLHRACEQLDPDGVPFHVFLFWLSPGPDHGK